MAELTREEFEAELKKHGYEEQDSDSNCAIYHRQVDSAGCYYFIARVERKPGDGTHGTLWLMFDPKPLGKSEGRSADIKICNKFLTAYDFDSVKQAERELVQEAKKEFIPKAIAKIDSKELSDLLK